MNPDMKKIVENTRREIAEQIHKNINFFIDFSKIHKKEDFFNEISKNTGISKRKIKGWYYYKHLPRLHEEDITIFCSYFNIHFSDFISGNIGIKDIRNEKIPPFNPATVAKTNILNALIKHNIYNAQGFESRFEANYTSNYYYVLQRKNKHQRNISWNFLIVASHYFKCPIGDFFLNLKKGD